MMHPTGTDYNELAPDALAGGAAPAALRREAQDWLRRLVSGEASGADLAALDQWRASSPAHAEAFAEAALLWDVLHDAARQAELDRSRIPADTAMLRSRFRPSRRGFLIGGTALAASAVGIMLIRPPLGLWPSATELAADYHTGTGERRQIDFNEHIAVELNTRTSLDVLSRTNDDVRVELIAGEAAVNNTSGRDVSVTVVAGRGRVTARRAAVNIRKVGADVRVSCTEGSVAVDCAGRSLSLEVGKQLAYDANGDGSVVDTDPDLVTAWQRGLLMFQRAPLAEVIEEVNRYRSGRIVLIDAALGRRQVIANFRLDRIDDVIDFISKAMNLRVRTLPAGVVLVG